MEAVSFPSILLRRVPFGWHLTTTGESRRPPSSLEERRAREVVERFGQPIADAQSVDVAVERIESTAGDPVFVESLVGLRISIDWNELVTLSLEGMALRMYSTLGKAAADVLGAGMRDEVAILASQLKLLALSDERGQSGRTSPSEHLAFVCDPSIPLTVIEALFGALKSQAAMVATLHGFVCSRRLDRPVAQHLAGVYREGMHRLLRVLASIPCTGVPLELVPKGERLDLRSLQGRHEAFWDAVAEGRHHFGVPDDVG